MIAEAILPELRRRRAAGETLKTLAAEVGVTWQKLDKAIRNGLPKHRHRNPSVPAACPEKAAQAPQSLAEKYRPNCIGTLFGQGKVIHALQKLVANPRPIALLFEGYTGTGKTSAAMVLAAELGCDLSQGELGGVWTISSGEQTAEAVRQTCSGMWGIPFYGSGWKVVIVNEADRVSAQAETIWLDRLEHMPPKTVIVFTTNHPEKLSPRFRDRCLRLEFTGNAEELSGWGEHLVQVVWQGETGGMPELALTKQIVSEAVEGGQLSMRRVIQKIEMALLLCDGRE